MKTVSYPLSEKTLAISYLTASVADTDTRVSEFRRQKLGSIDKLLKPEDVEKWIRIQFEADKKKVSDENSALIEGDARQQCGFEISATRETLLVYYGVPGQVMAHNLPSIRGGVTQQLRILSEEISRDYGWSIPNATMFILSGMTPIKPLITWEATRNEIVLRSHPSIPPEVVEHTFRQAKRELGAKTVRERGRRRGESIDRVRDLFLAQFIAVRVNRNLSPGDLLKKWNELVHDRVAWQTCWGGIPPKNLDDWTFEPGDLRGFAAAGERIKDKLLETRIGKNGVEKRHRIAIDTLFSLNPHFTRAEPKPRPKLVSLKPKWTVHRVAKELGVKTRQVYRLAGKGQIPPGKKIGSSLFWDSAEIEAIAALRKARKRR